MFLGPTAIHYSKTKTVFKKIASAVVSSCPNLGTKGQGFITDGEKALHDALLESMKKATGLRRFNHSSFSMLFLEVTRKPSSKAKTRMIWQPA